MTASERLDALAARGVQLYLSPLGELRATCEPEFALILAAAIPTLKRHRHSLVAELERLERERFRRLTASRVGRECGRGLGVRDVPFQEAAVT